MPIVSKTRLYRHLLNPLVPRRTDVALLILCMKLVTQSPTSTSGQDMEDVDVDEVGEMKDWLPPVEYLAAKRLHAELAEGGGFSTQVLQSGVLIALYEYGHAIYPAAYLSIGACARYGISAGFDGSGVEQMKKLYNWVEEEERKRVWWAVLILDRAVNLGNPSRSLATQEPHPSSNLPAVDDVWDAGASSPGESFTLSSPTSLRMGRFARFAQAIYLLGRVYKHVSDQTDDHIFLQEEAVQLRRTIEALVTLTEIEGSQGDKLEFCTQTALSYSGLLRLQDTFSSLPVGLLETDKWSSSTALVEKVATSAASLANMVCRGVPSVPIHTVSPFILDLFYHARIIWGERVRQTGSEDAIGAAEDLNAAIVGLNARWRAAGAYLEIMKACEMSYC
ncbi:hypothetical protein DL95DRAFT_398601 [Leptodontidium sp. 2 PMI_412]|nr:hypothetical protein DL95DRAFT_398601 [Leptodontidium sp. 2 PMI_412]